MMSSTPLAVDRPIRPWNMQTRSQCILYTGLELKGKCAYGRIYADGKCTRYMLLERRTLTGSAALAALHDTPLLIGVVYIWGKRGMDRQEMWMSKANSK